MDLGRSKTRIYMIKFTPTQANGHYLSSFGCSLALFIRGVDLSTVT